MVASGKFRSEDLSVYFFVKSIIGNYVSKIVDSYPYTAIEDGTLVVPSASIHHMQTVEAAGELGAEWYDRDWAVNIFALADTAADEIGDILYRALRNDIPIKDFSDGFNSDNGKARSGADLRVIEYVTPTDKLMRPSYPGFDTFQKDKYWKMLVAFSTESTGAV